MAPACGSPQRDTLHNARFGFSPKVLYPHHPLFGEDIEVFGSAGGQRDMVYVRLADNTTRGVPAWMFDPVVCAGVRAADEPVIECRALLDLARLVDIALEGRATVGDEPTTIRNQDNAGG